MNTLYEQISDDLYLVSGEGGTVHVTTLEDREIDQDKVDQIIAGMEKDFTDTHAHTFEFPLPKPIYDEESRRSIREQRKALESSHPAHPSKRRK